MVEDMKYNLCGPQTLCLYMFIGLDSPHLNTSSIYLP